MEFTYTAYKIDKDAKLLKDSSEVSHIIGKDVTTRFDEITEENVKSPNYVEVYDNRSNQIIKNLYDTSDYDDWRLKLERDFAWKPRLMNNLKSSDKYSKAVNPSHYKNFLDDYEWLDVQARLPRFSDKDNFKAAIELQIRKYLDRNGRKDDELQELQKGLFYYIYLVVYARSNKKPLVKDIHKILEQIYEIGV